MSLPSRLAALMAAVLLTSVAACSGSAPTSTSAGSSDPVAAELAARLDALPTVDGAVRTAQQADPDSATRTYLVPTGTPACLQILGLLDAGGYEVVTGAASDAVLADSCLTTVPTDPVGEAQGNATVLAAGGSSIALTWTATTYTLRVTP